LRILSVLCDLCGKGFFCPPTKTTLMPHTMLAVVKPEAKPGAEIREVKVPVSGAATCWSE